MLRANIMRVTREYEAGEGVPRGRYKTWTLDSGLDYGLDYGLNWTVASVLALPFKADYTNVRLPNEWRNGLTVGMGIYATISNIGWLLSLCFYSLLAQLVGKELRYTWLM